MKSIEKIILRNLIHNEDFSRLVIPFLKAEYFVEKTDEILYTKISEFIDKYNKLPTIEALEISCQNDKKITEDQFSEIEQALPTLNKEEVHFEWLVKETENFCKDRAVHNAILKSIGIIDGREKGVAQDAIPSILQEALGVCFDSSVGHDYLEDSDARYEFYTRKENKLEFDIDMLNKITRGGLTNKTLNVFLAATGVGKSLFMCHMAAAWLRDGKNVLYVTLEMAEERIAERIDANLLDISIEQLETIPKSTFDNRVKKITDKTQGKLIIKEYPTSSAHVNHFRTLLNELQLKRSFRPDVIFIDYLNICASSRYKPSAGFNSYTIIKAIAEEIRGLAVEFNLPIITATQTNRGGYGNTDVELTDTSESMGLPMSVDLMLALISSEELEQMNQVMIKQLKNRYSDPGKYKRFVVGVDRSKMRVYNLEEGAQANLSDAGHPKIEQKFNVGNVSKFSSDRFASIKV